MVALLRCLNSGLFIFGVLIAPRRLFTYQTALHSQRMAVCGSAITGNHRIQHFTTDGTFIGQFGVFGANAGQLYTPHDITLDTDGSLWVADYDNNFTNNRIQHFNADGNYISQLGSQGSDAGQFPYINGTAMGSDRSLWVADRNRLQKFIPIPKGTTAHPYKAIILAGSGEKFGNQANSLWDGTWQAAQKAAKALEFQGFKPHEEILFLTAGNTQFDLDNNGQLDDLQAATKESLRLAITGWAKDSTDVVLYLAGLSSAGQFQLNGTETLSAAELSAWLADLNRACPPMARSRWPSNRLVQAVSWRVCQPKPPPHRHRQHPSRATGADGRPWRQFLLL